MTALSTNRLLLRPLTLDDAEAAFEWTSDDRVTKYMSYSSHNDINVTLEWLKNIKTSDTAFEFGIVRRSDNMLIGSCGIALHDDGFWAFGYNLRFDCWGMGYATEAVQAMMNNVRQNFKDARFMAECVVENTASARVIEKCGLVFKEYSEFRSFDGKKLFKTKIFESR